MIVDAEHISPGSTLRSRLAIIGAGPAGIVTRRGDRLSPGARAMLQALREAAGFDTQGPDADSD